MASVMSSFQRKVHKLLVKNGWVLRRFTGSGHAMYEKMVQWQDADDRGFVLPEESDRCPARGGEVR